MCKCVYIHDMCRCLYIHVICRCVCPWISTEARRECCLSSVILHLTVLKQSLLLNLKLTVFGLDWRPIRLRDLLVYTPSPPCPASELETCDHDHIQVFRWGLGSRTQTPCSYSMGSYALSHLPSPYSCFREKKTEAWAYMVKVIQVIGSNLALQPILCIVLIMNKDDKSWFLFKFNNFWYISSMCCKYFHL